MGLTLPVSMASFPSWTVATSCPMSFITLPMPCAVSAFSSTMRILVFLFGCSAASWPLTAGPVGFLGRGQTDREFTPFAQTFALGDDRPAVHLPRAY
jgi:hypothetical protein